jgi:hypothetical protein
MPSYLLEHIRRIHVYLAVLTAGTFVLPQLTRSTKYSIRRISYRKLNIKRMPSSGMWRRVDLA